MADCTCEADRALGVVYNTPNGLCPACEASVASIKYHADAYTPEPKTITVKLTIDPARLQDAIAEVRLLLQNLRTFANSTFGKFATGGPVRAGKLGGGDSVELFVPTSRPATLHGKRAHGFVADDVEPWAPQPVAAMKCACGRCDACLGPVKRADDGQRIAQPKPSTERRTFVADQVGAIKEGLDRLERERSEWLNTHDTDDAAPDGFVYGVGGWVGRSHCVGCGADNAAMTWRYACTKCVAQMTPDAREHHYNICQAAAKPKLGTPGAKRYEYD